MISKKLVRIFSLLAAIGCLLVLVMQDPSLYLAGPRASSKIIRYSEPNNSSGLNLKSKIQETFSIDGALFMNGDLRREVKATVNVSLVYSFSPYTENHFREMMIDPTRDEHRVYANSPAILRLENGQIITVMRIWLEKEIWEKSHGPHNTFSDNYFYVQRFDSSMKAITRGRVLGIPTPIQWTTGDGPIEPRIFCVNDTIYVTFNTGIFTDTMRPIDTTFIWDLTNNRALMPKIEGGQPMTDNKKSEDSMPRDKHWAAIVNRERLFFTYNLDPLRVMECELNGGPIPKCRFVHKEGASNYTFNDYRDCLRGGTPFVLYKYPYYVSVAHGTHFRTCDGSCNYKRYYTVHVVVIKVEPDFKVVYLSGNVPLPNKSLEVPIVRHKYIEHSFLFPVGLLVEDEDSLIIGGHINDHSSVLYRLSGLREIMNKAIAHDKLDTGDGPRPGVLQHYTRLTTERYTGFKFYV